MEKKRPIKIRKKTVKPASKMKKRVVKKDQLQELQDQLTGANKPLKLSITQRFKEQLKKLIGMKT